MTRQKTTSNRILVPALVVVLAVILILYFVQRAQPPLHEGLSFTEYTRDGNAAFIILGDYFHKAFAKELGSLLLDLPPGCRTYFVCTDEERAGLLTWMEKENLPRASFHTSDKRDPLMRVWARDVVLAGSSGAKLHLIVSPNPHARTEEETKLYHASLRELFPDEMEIETAPFVFEAGNMIFVKKGNRTTLLLGKKVLSDNARYQRNSWTPGWEREELIEKIGEFFGVDSVVVLGSPGAPPPPELYFEGRLDMCLTVLREQNAVVVEFPFGEKEDRELRTAVEHRHPVIASLFEREKDPEEIYDILKRRLESFSRELELYAYTVSMLGLKVHRSPSDWKHVAAWMSWTNVVHAGTKLFIPVYPDSMAPIVETVRDERGYTSRQIRLDAIAREQFSLVGLNRANHDLYAGMGYKVVPLPEYLHYSQGGLHSLINILY